MANAISTLASSNCRSSSVISRKSAASPNFQPATSRAFRLSASIGHSSLVFFGLCFPYRVVVILEPLLAAGDNLVGNLRRLLCVHIDDQYGVGIQPVHDS